MAKAQKDIPADPAPANPAETAQHAILDVNDIVRSPYQVRAEDDDGLDALAADMAANGLIQPVTARVRVRYGDGSVSYELIAGHRRLAAARKLRWRTIPAIVVEADDKQAEAMLVAENFARRDLTPLEMADTAAGLVKRHGAAVAARICGKSERWAQRMAYIAGRITEDWRTVARAYKLSQASLEALCKGTAASQRDLLDDILADLPEGSEKSMDALVKIANGPDAPDELLDGGNKWDLSPDSGEKISSFPWQRCGCGDCDKCTDRTDCVPEIAFDDEGDERFDEPHCLGKRCHKAKMKEWCAGRGIRAWSEKLGREVIQLPKNVNYWVGRSEEDSTHTVPCFLGAASYPPGCVNWFSPDTLRPEKEKKPEKRWPTPQELRETAFCEAVEDVLKMWKPTTANLMRLAVALIADCPIAGKSEWANDRRIALAKELSAGDAEAAILDAVRRQVTRSGLVVGSEFGPVKSQMDFWRELAGLLLSDTQLDTLKKQAAALAERRIEDVAAAKKAEKKAGKSKEKKR